VSQLHATVACPRGSRSNGALAEDALWFRSVHGGDVSDMRTSLTPFDRPDLVRSGVGCSAFALPSCSPDPESTLGHSTPRFVPGCVSTLKGWVSWLNV
jgi:hypothetical protein